ncbi:alpha/beta fold hydrolase [Pelagibacterium montanilacus]|uniref:alpha/beta fold hydrolase n=1 Tax=Pelagibacterium montanilacus TaxID=2185280 RepID=UPI000F8CFC5A|nr:alpha/beta hydrolase [Pelagibacterium montanilacus]
MTAVQPQATEVEIDDDNAIHAIHHRPQANLTTFVFANSMGASTEVWEPVIAPLLREKGYGTLSFDYRGQGKSRYGATALLEPDEIISDIGLVCERLQPQRPVLVGLSIGGMFAARAWLAGTRAEGLVLINTLRKPTAQTEWINTLEDRLIAIGGTELLFDVLRPVLSGRDELERMRPSHLREGGYYTAPPPDNPRLRLAHGVHKADWALPYEALMLPTLVLTGLHDRLFRIQEDVDELAARLPDATVITFPDGGHGLQAEHPERFVSALTAFSARKLGA